jgi:hypothetical protein
MPQRDSAAFNIYIDGILANATWHLLATAESADAERLDTATLEYKGAVLEDLDVASLLHKEVEVVRVADGAVVHWGKTTIVPATLSSSAGEVLTVISRCEMFHLGSQVDGYWVWDPISTPAAARVVDGDLVFNPLIDGRIYGNLNDTQLGPGLLPLFLDPESVRTAAAGALQGANITLWSLAGAVDYLLKALNDAETNISNPTLAQLQGVFNDPADLVQNVRIPRGTYLAQALDLLLVPLGYHWRVKRTAQGARQFAFWKRGTGGSLVRIYHQRVHSTLSNPRNLGETDVDTAGITFDASRLANNIVVRGGLEEYEVTVELARAWPEDQDNHPEWVYFNEPGNTSFPTVANAWRKWVLNEAGDYIGLRPEIDGVFTSAFRTALSGIGAMSKFVPRRRKLLPTLTLGPDGAPIGTVHGIEVEYSNTDPPSWKSTEGWGIQLLEREAGISLGGGVALPEFLLATDDRSLIKIRVTATVQADFRLTGSAPRQGNSPQLDIVPLTLDLPDRFSYRVRHSALSKYGGGALPSLAVDDLFEISEFAEFVRDSFDLLDVGGVIQIEGLDNTYTVGDRVEKIEHKNISFMARTGSAAYPQIMGIERDIERQTTTLHLQRVRGPLPLAQPTRGTTHRFSPRSVSR